MSLSAEQVNALRWDFISKNVPSLEKQANKSTRLAIARQCHESCLQLQKDGFLNTHPEYMQRWVEYIKVAAAYMDVDTSALEAAMDNHFYALHVATHGKEAPFTIEYGEKSDGMQLGRLCTVTSNGVSKIFYAKTHQRGPRSSDTSSTRHKIPDVKELFCYNLLEAIGVGPKVEFVIPHFGTRLVYIVTEGVDGLCRMDKLDASSLSPRVALQIHLISSILRITDIHDANCGQVEREGVKQPVLFDFRIGGSNLMSAEPRVVRLFLNQLPEFATQVLVGGGDVADYEKVESRAEMIKNVEEEEKRRIAGESIVEWKLEERINEAWAKTHNFMAYAENMLVLGGGDLDSYVEGVKHNAALFK